MTAPTRTRGKTATAPDKRTTRTGNGSPDKRTTQRNGSTTGQRSSSAERAYARRAARAEQARATQGKAASGTGAAARRSRKFRLRLPRSRAGFVLLIMAMLATGVVITLWLSTQAIAGSYKLEQLHEKNAALAERVAQLQRVVTKRESATWLAEQAKQVGMVPGGFPAKLVVQPDGSVDVVGEPKKVTAPAPPPPPPPPPPEEPPAGQAPPPPASNEESGQPPEQPAGGQAPPENESDTVSAGAGG